MTNNRRYKIADLNITESGAKVRAQISLNVRHWVFHLKLSSCSFLLLQLFKVSTRGTHTEKKKKKKEKKKKAFSC